MQSHFERCDFTGANLNRGTLKWIDWTDAMVRDANLSAANLSAARLTGTELRGADLSGARLEGVTFLETKYDATTRFPARFQPGPGLVLKG